MPGNERLDSLAQEAAITAVLRSPVPRTNVVPTIREAIIAILQERWNVHGASSKMGENSVSPLELYLCPKTVVRRQP